MYNFDGYFIPVISFSIYQLIDLMRECGSIELMLKKMTEFSVEVKRVANHRWANDYFRLRDSCGIDYKFQIYLSKTLASYTYPKSLPRKDVYELSLWSMSEYSLGETLYLYDKDLSHNTEVVKHAQYIMDRFTNGLVVCSACGKEQKLEDIKNNRYFAGVYCQKCWDGKYKAIEAKENYN